MKKENSLVSIIIIILLSILVVGLSSYIIIDKINKNKKDDNITQMIIYLEGMEEIINVKKYNSQLGFCLYYDIDRFTVHKEGDSEIIKTRPENQLISVTIEKIDKNFNDVKSELEFYENGRINNFETIIYTQNEGGIVVTNYYINTSKGVYIIKELIPNNSEYAEGFGARIYQMLETFSIE